MKGQGCGVYIVDDDGRVLLTQRGPGARHQHYKWEAPGGAVEPGETFETAAKREIREELGVEVELIEVLAERENVIDSNGDAWKALLYLGKIKEQPVIQEPEKCVGYGWFSREELNGLSLADYIVDDLRLIG